MTDSFLFDPNVDDQKLLALVVEHYHATFQTNVEAQDFLRKRGIYNEAAIEQFRIGYSDYSLQSRLPSFVQKAGKHLRARLSAMGLMHGRSHQVFKGCLVFPVTAADGSGQVVDLYGRRVAKASDTRCPRHRYMSPQRRGVWNVEALAETDVVILCPSILDALTFWNAGFKNVSCTFGNDALTDDHLAAFREFRTRRVLVLSESIAPRLLAAGLECYLLPMPPGEDVSRVLFKQRDKLGTLVQRATPLGKGSAARAATVNPIVPKPILAQPSTSTPAMLDRGIPGAVLHPAQPSAPRSPTTSLTLDLEDDQKLLAQVIEYYQRTLKTNTEGLDYLRKRGITSGEALDAFRIGYADRTLCECLPSPHVKVGKEIRQRLQELGINRTSGHEHLAGCVVFPIPAADGSQRIVDIYGRMTGTQLRKGTLLDKHLNDGCPGVWNIQALRAGQEIILSPSLMDALTFWSAGYRNVTCMFGRNALTDDLLRAFAEFEIRRVLVSDEAVAPKLMAAGIDVYLMHFPQGMDAGKHAQGYQDPSRALGLVIRRAEWIGKGEPPSTGLVTGLALLASETDEEAAPRSSAPTSATVSTPVSTPVAEEPQPFTFEDDADDAEAEDAFDDELDEGEVDDDADDDLAADLAADEADDHDVELEEFADEPEEDEPAEPVLSASPLPAAPPEDEIDRSASEYGGDEVVVHLGHRRYRIRGLAKNLSFDQLKLNLLASTEKGMYVDTFDLYAARHRRQFVVQAAIELGVDEATVKKDLGRVLLKLEALQDEQISAMLEPKAPAPVMTAEEKEAALRLLRDPHLIERIVDDFDVVGETNNKLVGYLAAISRKLDQPLAIIIQSSSAAGKTSLMEAVLAFVPIEDQVKYSAMTGQSLFYMGETNLKHKILAIVEEEGAERASYALKLLQSEGELMIASTGKDADTGRLVTQEYRVEGPVMIFLTTTAIKIDEELLNRCIILSVDENREQTKAIHQAQRRRQTLAGLLAAQDRQEKLALHRNAQRLLRPLLVANPYAESLTFLDDKTRTRRDHVKYLTLIRTIALLHQYQRPVKTVPHGDHQIEYIEVTLDDIATANRLACEALGRSAEELPPQTRRLLGLIDDLVSEACVRQVIDPADYRFSRRDVREFTGWGHTQLKIHLKRLEELEYLLVHRGGRGQSFVYELLYQPPPDASKKFLARLIDVERLRQQFDEKWSGAGSQWPERGRPQIGTKSAGGRPAKNDATAVATRTLREFPPELVENAP
jgi:Fe2+ transport system protein FeoA